MQEIEKKLVWLDCDPGHDDAAAIILAGVHPKLQLIGISTIFGNSSVENTTNNALGILKMAGIEKVQVYQGQEKPIFRPNRSSHVQFHGKTGFDGCQLPQSTAKPIIKDSIHQIYQKIKEFFPRKVTLIAVGPLTNISLLVKNYPDLNNYVDQISIMGGAIGRGNITSAAEFNIYCDPEAAQIVFNSQLPIFLAPLELTSQISYDNKLLETIKLTLANSLFSQRVASFLGHYLQQYHTIIKQESAILHDPVAVFYLICPDAFQISLQNVEVECKSSFCDGRTVVDTRNCDRKPNVHIGQKVDTQKFWDCFFQVLTLCNKQALQEIDKNQVD